MLSEMANSSQSVLVLLLVSLAQCNPSPQGMKGGKGKNLLDFSTPGWQQPWTTRRPNTRFPATTPWWWDPATTPWWWDPATTPRPWHPTTPPQSCGGFFNAPLGTISSPNYPNDYDNSLACSYLITTQGGGGHISITFEVFELESSYDWLHIYDGSNENAPLVGRYTGYDNPGTLESTGNSLYIFFETDGSVQRRGFFARYTALEQTAVRLVGGSGSHEGRVEVQYDGEWGTVCDDDWDLMDAHVACRNVGYTRAINAYGGAYFGQGSGQIWYDNVQCAGWENDLYQCERNPMGIHDCTHKEDAGVTCISDVRLVDGYNAYDGRVEVLHDGEWGTVCDDNWDIWDADVVCQSMGYGWAVSAHGGAYFGEGSGRIWMDEVQCKGLETDIFDCPMNPLGYTNCVHKEDAGVRCRAYVEMTGALDGDSSLSVDTGRGNKNPQP